MLWLSFSGMVVGVVVVLVVGVGVVVVVVFFGMFFVMFSSFLYGVTNFFFF